MSGTGALLLLLLPVAVRLAVPILLAALGEVVVERTGLVNVAIEGMMLVGSFAAVLATLGTGSPWTGVAAGIGAGTALAALLALLTVRLGGDVIVAGTGLNLLALGVTGSLYQLRFGTVGAAVSIPMLPPWLLGAPLTTHAAVAAAAAVAFLLARTGLGLRLRACGDAPHAVTAAGASVGRLRAGALLAGGALAGAGGAALVVAHAGTFVEGITAGRGFIALALVLSARRRPIVLLGASLCFGLALALQFELQARALGVPYQLVRALPYIATLLVLAAARSRSAAGRTEAA